LHSRSRERGVWPCSRPRTSRSTGSDGAIAHLFAEAGTDGVLALIFAGTRTPPATMGAAHKSGSNTVSPRTPWKPRVAPMGPRAARSLRARTGISATGPAAGTRSPSPRRLGRRHRQNPRRLTRPRLPRSGGRSLVP
jgi:hypothetical protein